MHSALTSPVGGGDHVQGSSQAPITLVEYGDYECPYCGAAYPIVKELQARLGATLRFVFRNFPLREQHPHAQAAAEAAEAAGAQGKFWEMHDSLYEDQQRLGVGMLFNRAVGLGLDLARWQQDMRARVFSERVQHDYLSGVRSGVNGTPTFFINGARHDGAFDLESLLFAIDGTVGNLPTAAAAPASNVAPPR